MKPLDQSQQEELAHLTRISLLHPNSRLDMEWKARDLAGRMPNRWGWLPAALSTALEQHDKATSTTGEATQ